MGGGISCIFHCHSWRHPCMDWEMKEMQPFPILVYRSQPLTCCYSTNACSLCIHDRFCCIPSEPLCTKQCSLAHISLTDRNLSYTHSFSCYSLPRGHESAVSFLSSFVQQNSWHSKYFLIEWMGMGTRMYFPINLKSMKSVQENAFLRHRS